MEQDEVKSVNVLETPCLNSSFAEDDALRSFGLGKTFFSSKDMYSFIHK